MFKREENENIMVAEAVTEVSTAVTHDYEKQLRMQYPDFMVEVDEKLEILGHYANCSKTKDYVEVSRITIKVPRAIFQKDEVLLNCYLNSEKAFKLVSKNMHRATASWQDLTHTTNSLYAELRIAIKCRYPENHCTNSCAIS